VKYLLLVISLIFSSAAFSARLSGTVEGYIPYSSGEKEILIFKLANSATGGCNTTQRFAIDSNDKKYKATLSAILAAFHSKTTVAVDYLPSCNAWGNSADIRYICVGNINC
jgi:hypothetical protein